jgi:hypothetical protein
MTHIDPYVESFLSHCEEVERYMDENGVMETNLSRMIQQIQLWPVEDFHKFLPELRKATLYLIMQYHFYVSGNVYTPLVELLNTGERHSPKILYKNPVRKNDKHPHSSCLSRKSIEGCLFDMEQVFKMFKKDNMDHYKVTFSLII